MLVTRASASAPRSNADVFDTIYKHRGWGGDGVDASLSGSGSSLANTKRLCGLLGQLVHEASQNATVVTFLDAPMGDWFWMSRCLPSMAQNLRNGGRRVYQGGDVSAPALAHASAADVARRRPRHAVQPYPPSAYAMSASRLPQHASSSFIGQRKHPGRMSAAPL